MSFAALEDAGYNPDLVGRNLTTPSGDIFDITRVDRLYFVRIPLRTTSQKIYIVTRSGHRLQIPVASNKERKSITNVLVQNGGTLNTEATQATDTLQENELPKQIAAESSMTNVDSDSTYILYDAEDVDVADFAELSKYLTADHKKFRALTPHERDNWHAHIICGHASVRQLKFMHKNGLLPPHVHYHPDSAMPGCKACLLGKSHRQKVNRQDSPPDDKLQPGEKLVADIWGPVATPSLGNFRYLLTVIDPCRVSGWSKVILLEI